MKDIKGDEARLKHISDAISEIQKYIKNLSLESFCDNSIVDIPELKRKIKK